MCLMRSQRRAILCQRDRMWGVGVEGAWVDTYDPTLSGLPGASVVSQFVSSGPSAIRSTPATSAMASSNCGVPGWGVSPSAPVPVPVLVRTGIRSRPGRGERGGVFSGGAVATWRKSTAG